MNFCNCACKGTSCWSSAQPAGGRAPQSVGARPAAVAHGRQLEPRADGRHGSQRFALGAYEILYTATPGRVAINEAVELAKRFGTAHSTSSSTGSSTASWPGTAKKSRASSRRGAPYEHNVLRRRHRAVVGRLRLARPNRLAVGLSPLPAQMHGHCRRGMILVSSAGIAAVPDAMLRLPGHSHKSLLGVPSDGFSRPIQEEVRRSAAGSKARPGRTQPNPPAGNTDEPTVRVGPTEKTILAAPAPIAPSPIAPVPKAPAPTAPVAAAPTPSAPPPAAKAEPAPPAKAPVAPPPAAATTPPAEPTPAPVEPPKKTGFFAKIREGLKKTTRILNTDIRDLFKSEGRLVDDAFLDELLEILIKTDMGVTAAQQAIDQVRTDFRGRVVHMEEVVGNLKKKLKELLKQPEEPIRFAPTGTTVIMVAGVNGAGKTTSIAKLARTFDRAREDRRIGRRRYLPRRGRRAADRVGGPARRRNRHGRSQERSGQRRPSCGSPAVESGADVCIIDTAGRLQTQQNLMKELTKIHNVISKKVPGAPHEVLLVLDATTGQNGISQAKSFSEAVQCTGIVLAKIDGTAKGGVVVAIRQQVGLPVKYLGVGEKAEDMTLFNPDQFVEAMFEDLLPSGNAL